MLDTFLTGLMLDVDRSNARVRAQLRADPDHEVALAMFTADVRRAERRLSAYLEARPTPVRRYVDGMIAA